MLAIGLVKEGTAKHVFVFDQTRLSRNNITKAVISESLRKAGVQLHTYSKRYDFNKEEDENITAEGSEYIQLGKLNPQTLKDLTAQDAHTLQMFEKLAAYMRKSGINPPDLG